MGSYLIIALSSVSWICLELKIGHAVLSAIDDTWARIILSPVPRDGRGMEEGHRGRLCDCCPICQK